MSLNAHMLSECLSLLTKNIRRYMSENVNVDVSCFVCLSTQRKDRTAANCEASFRTLRPLPSSSSDNEMFY